MSARNIVRTGYDYVRKYTFTLDGAAENLSTATIKASLKSADKSVELIADTSQDSAATGAAWGTGDVVLQFAAAATAAIDTAYIGQSAWIEVAVTLSGKRLAYDDIPVVIEKGYVLT